MEDKKMIKECIIKYIKSTEIKERNMPYIISRNEGNPKTYSLNDILLEIENESEFGQKTCQNIVTLTIDLLVRGKEQLP